MAKLAAVTMVRDEQDIIEYIVANLFAREVDIVIVADNLSEDQTPAILNRLKGAYGDRLMVIEDAEEAYYQSKKITNLAHLANRNYGATHILPFDADEYWYSTDKRSLKEVICTNRGIVAATVYEHRATLLDPVDLNPISRISWRLKAPLQLHKLAYCYSPELVVAQGNHLITNLQGHGQCAEVSKLAVRHYPQRSPRQLLNKVKKGGKAYAMTNLDPKIGAHWRQWYQIFQQGGENAIYEIFLQHYYYPRPWAEEFLIYDPAPIWSR